MIRIFLTLLLLLILWSGAADAGQGVVVVQSIRIPPYEEAINGFQRVCHAKCRRLVLSELKGSGIEKRISDLDPHLIVAIGTDALAKVIKMPNIPVVYLMVLNPQAILSGEKHISGVSMHIPQQKQLAILKEALPETRKVGLIYDPDKTGPLVTRAQKAAERMGIQLIANKVHRSGDVPPLIRGMKEDIDVFWMIPDITVLTPATVEFLILFSLENKIPILTFSDKYVELGALISIGIDPFDLGRQAGERANMIISRNRTSAVQEMEVRKVDVSINLKIAEKLGITVGEKIINKARIID